MQRQQKLTHNRNRNNHITADKPESHSRDTVNHCLGDQSINSKDSQKLTVDMCSADGIYEFEMQVYSLGSDSMIIGNEAEGFFKSFYLKPDTTSQKVPLVYGVI